MAGVHLDPRSLIVVSAENPDVPAPAERPRNEPRLPWEGKARRVDILCWAGITFSGIYALALLPLVPSLLGRNPVLLEFLRGSTTSMVTAGAFAKVGEASLLLAILAPFPIMMLFDPLYWWAGKLWGRPVIDMFAGDRPRAKRWVDKVENNAGRIGPPAVILAYVLPIPSALIYAAVGWTGMRLRLFLILDFIGTALWVAINVGLGYIIGQSAVDVAKAISRYALILTVVLVVVVIVVQVRRSSRTPNPL
jgi:membrane protein DedA with SNARE-associated domain